MVAALAILGLVIDDLVFDLDLADAEVALEVGGVVLRVPQAELDAGEEGELGRLSAAVGHLEFPDLQVLAQRHEIAGLGLDFVACGTDGGVAHAVAAFVFVQIAARGLPGRRPELAAFVVADVEIAPAKIKGCIVVAVAGQAAQAGIAVKGVTAGGVGDDAEIRLAAQVIDPGQGSLRGSDHVFPMLVVKMSVTHDNVFPFCLLSSPIVNAWLLHTSCHKLLCFCPVGAFDISPAILSLGSETNKFPVRPYGT